MTETLEFDCNGAPTSLDIDDGETLLSVLRERLGLISPKDGCAPQGQCGCCTIWVDGAPRVACVTPAARVAGRSVTTLEGADPSAVEALAAKFLATGAAQCGFCTPGIMMRCLPLVAGGAAPSAVAVDRALAAHLCRCTGWNTITEALMGVSAAEPLRDLDGASQRATLEGGVAQRIDIAGTCGQGGFADDRADRDALVAVIKPDQSEVEALHAAGHDWVVAGSLFAARSKAAKVQGRRTTAALVPPILPMDAPDKGVALATCFVEPAYLEPDASWCEPGGDPVSATGNGGAFGAKTDSVVERAARELAQRTGRTVRVVLAREDVVRIGPKRAPMSAIAKFHERRCEIKVASPRPLTVAANPYAIDVTVDWDQTEIVGPAISTSPRAPWAEAAILLEGALESAQVVRAELIDDAWRRVLLDVCVVDPAGGAAGAAIELSDAGDRIEHVRLQVMAGEILDVTVARSYCIGAVHMALGWVLSEGLTVDSDGEVHDLTIRSFGIIRPKAMPKVTVEFVDDERRALRGSDAVFVATAAATWNAVKLDSGERPNSFPALAAPIARSIRK